MSEAFGRTRTFSKRIGIEREALRSANLFSEQISCTKLLGLNDTAISVWINALESNLEHAQVRLIERTVRELARGTGLLSDESRCAVAEGKVSADFPTLVQAFKEALSQAVDPDSQN